MLRLDPRTWHVQDKHFPPELHLWSVYHQFLKSQSAQSGMCQDMCYVPEFAGIAIELDLQTVSVAKVWPLMLMWGFPYLPHSRPHATWAYQIPSLAAGLWMHCAPGTAFLKAVNFRDCWHHLISRWHFYLKFYHLLWSKLCINQGKGDIDDIFAYNTEEMSKTSFHQLW